MSKSISKYLVLVCYLCPTFRFNFSRELASYIPRNCTNSRYFKLTRLTFLKYALRPKFVANTDNKQTLNDHQSNQISNHIKKQTTHLDNTSVISHHTSQTDQQIYISQYHPNITCGRSHIVNVVAAAAADAVYTSPSSSGVEDNDDEEEEEVRLDDDDDEEVLSQLNY